MIALVAIVLQALLPATFIGGMAGIRTFELTGHGPDLINRMVILAGMVLGLMTLSLISMLLMWAINGLVFSQKTRNRAGAVKSLRLR